MPVFAITIEWHQSVIGVSETYWTRGNVSLQLIPSRVQTLLQKRRNMMFTNQQWVGVRVSDLGDAAGNLRGTRKSAFLIPGKRRLPGLDTYIDIPESGAIAITTTNSPDQTRAALQLSMVLGNGRVTKRYLAGIPDNMSKYEPGTFDEAANPTWVAAFNSFAVELQNNWSVIGRVIDNDGAPINVTRLVQQTPAPGLVGIQVPSAATPTFQVGDKIHLTGFRPCPGERNWINKIWYVDSVVTDIPPAGQRTYWLRGSSAQDPAKIRIMGQVSKVIRGLVNIDQITPLRVGMHKRGRPSHAPHGRRKTRPSLPC